MKLREEWLRQLARILSWLTQRCDGARPTRPAGHEVTQTLRNLAEQEERQPLDVSALLCLVSATGSGLTRLPQVTSQGLADLRTVTRRLVRRNQHREALDLLEALLPAWDPPRSAGLHAVAQHARLSLDGRPPSGLHRDAKAALIGADECLAGGDISTTAELVTIGAGLLLHRDLHADRPSSPLVEDPSSFLAPFRDSTAMVTLASPPKELQEPGGTTALASSRGDRHTLHIVVLSGAYPRFSASLVAALQSAGHSVTILDPVSEHRPFRWLGTDPEQVLLRLRTATLDAPARELAANYGVPPRYLQAMDEADVIVADWADKAAVWASIAAPPHARVVVRAHGMDVFSLWPHAVNWSRVDALVSVSPHQAKVLDEILAASAVPVGATSYPPCEVVPNIVELGEPSEPTAREARTLGLIGWNKRVKDPLWAVEVLSRLRVKDPGGGWRLRLIGADFSPGGVATSHSYAASFRARIAQPDVAGAVELTGHSDDIAAEARRLGFVLSSSVRESFHLGLVEGVLGGAVPVVREWPFFAGYRGASTLFPSEWVVPDIDAAVHRIWELREPDMRDSAATRAREDVHTRFSARRTEQLLLDLVTGRDRQA